MSEIGRIFIFCGVLLIGFGVAIMVLGRIPGIGKLPGDIMIKRENFSFYFPLSTCLLISALISVILYLWNRK